MPAVEASGTQTAVVDTEHTLAALTSTRSLQFWIDANAMAAGDELIVRFKRKVLSSGTIRPFMHFRLSGSQPSDRKVVGSIPFAAPHGVTVTLEQEAGTGRAFPWSLESL